MTGKLCKKLCEAAFEESKKIGIPVCFAISDAHGLLFYFNRQKGSLLVSIDIAQNKAYTSAALKMPTGDLGPQCQPGAAIYGMNTANSRLILFGGGFPLTVDGEVIGAIGVSGGSVEDDEQIGRAVLAAFEKCIKEDGGYSL